MTGLLFVSITVTVTDFVVVLPNAPCKLILITPVPVASGIMVK